MNGPDDPELAELADLITLRLQDGLPVDPDDLAARLPGQADMIRRLIPPLRDLASLGRAAARERLIVNLGTFLEAERRRDGVTPPRHPDGPHEPTKPATEPEPDPNRIARERTAPMSDTVNTLAQQTGIQPDLVQKGLGALLEFLKDRIGGDAFGKILEQLPDLGGLVGSGQAEPAGGQGGLLGTIAGLAGKLLGDKADDLTKLLAALAGAGFSLEQVQSFLPRALELLKNFVPAELFEQILKSVTGSAGTDAGAGAGAAS